MSNAAEFLTAARHQPPIVLRRQLQDFTVGHYLFLSEVDSPFLPGSSDRPMQCLDLFLAVQICSGPATTQRKAIAEFPKWRQRLWDWQCRNLDPIAEAKKFRHYVTNSFDVPKLTDGGGPESALPNACGIVAFLAGCMNQQYDVIQNIPFSSAVWMCAGWRERNFRGDVVDESQVFKPWTQSNEEFWNAAQEFARKEMGN